MPVERLRHSRPIKSVSPYQKTAGAVRITQSKKRLSAYRTYDTFYLLKRLIKLARTITHHTNPKEPADEMEWKAAPTASPSRQLLNEADCESMETHTTVAQAGNAADNGENRTESVRALQSAMKLAKTITDENYKDMDQAYLEHLPYMDKKQKDSYHECMDTYGCWSFSTMIQRWSNDTNRKDDIEAALEGDRSHKSMTLALNIQLNAMSYHYARLAEQAELTLKNMEAHAKCAIQAKKELRTITCKALSINPTRTGKCYGPSDSERKRLERQNKQSLEWLLQAHSKIAVLLEENEKEAELSFELSTILQNISGRADHLLGALYRS